MGQLRHTECKTEYCLAGIGAYGSADVIERLLSRKLGKNMKSFKSNGQIMSRILKWAALITLLTAILSQFLAAGERVSIVLRSGEHISGELLGVGASAIVIAIEAGLHDEILKMHPEKIRRVEKDSIQELSVFSPSHLWDGVLLGMIGGVCVGMLVSYEPTGADSYKSNYDPQGGGPKMLIICGAGGAALGALAGETAQGFSKDFDVTRMKSLVPLKEYSHYKEYEPEFITELLRR